MGHAGTMNTAQAAAGSVSFLYAGKAELHICCNGKEKTADATSEEWMILFKTLVP